MFENESVDLSPMATNDVTVGAHEPKERKKNKTTSRAAISNRLFYFISPCSLLFCHFAAFSFLFCFCFTFRRRVLGWCSLFDPPTLKL